MKTKIRALDFFKFQNTVGRLLDRLARLVFIESLGAGIIICICISIPMAKFGKLEMYSVICIVLTLVLIILRTAYVLILTRVEFISLISGKLLQVATGKSVKGASLGVKFCPSMLTPQQRVADWTLARVACLPEFVGRLEGVTQVILYVLMWGSWENLNRSILRVEGDQEIALRPTEHYTTDGVIATNASWIEPWVGETEEHVPHLRDLTEVETVMVLLACGLFWGGYCWWGVGVALLISPLLIFRLLLFYTHIVKVCQGMLLEKIQSEKASP